jgi:hypothetical protein
MMKSVGWRLALNRVEELPHLCCSVGRGTHTSSEEENKQSSPDFLLPSWFASFTCGLLDHVMTLGFRRDPVFPPFPVERECFS